MLKVRHSLQHDTITNIAEIIGQVLIFTKAGFKLTLKPDSASFLLFLTRWVSCESLLLDLFEKDVY